MASQSPADRQPGDGGFLVFLDRDGTIMEDRHFMRDPGDVCLLPGAAEGLRQMKRMGARLVVVTNQSGVGRGYFDLASVERVNHRLVELLAATGVTLDGTYVCPHRPEDGCTCRKPGTKLLQTAAEDLGIAPAGSFMIGDKATDIEAGRRFGASTVLVAPALPRCFEPRPDCTASDLVEAARFVKTCVAREKGTRSGGCPPHDTSPGTSATLGMMSRPCRGS